MITLENILEGRSSLEEQLVFLEMHSEDNITAERLTEFARTLRKYSTRIHPSVQGTLIDTCGTGGDSKGTFNISTAAALVVAGVGNPVAKHGNRSITSNCGSADVLEELGVPIDLEPEQVQQSIETNGFGFMYAPQFHSALKHIQAARQAFGKKTIFNVLGPLTNPANAEAQVIGVYSEKLLPLVASALVDLGVNNALVVHSAGMDELSTLNETIIYEVCNKKITNYTISPEDFGFTKPKLEELKANSKAESARIIKNILHGEEGPCLDITLLNASAGIYVSGKVKTIEEGVLLARKSINSGSALQKLNHLALLEKN